jgi:hypothetical protein
MDKTGYAIGDVAKRQAVMYSGSLQSADKQPARQMGNDNQVHISLWICSIPSGHLQGYKPK